MKEIAKQYAEAVFALACEERCEDAVMTALDDVAALFDQNPEYMELLSAPGIPLTERVGLIQTTFGARVPETVSSLLGLLCEKGRLRLFSFCRDEYRRLLHVRRAVVTAKVTSAVPLTEKERKALIQQLQKKNGGTVRLSCEIDPSIMGGVIVEMEGAVIDGSLRRRLRDVKEVMRNE